MGSNWGVDIYDLDQVLFNAFGVQISEGPGITSAAEGGYIEIEQDGPDFKVKKGAAGRLVRSKTNEPYTILRVHLLQTSKKNAVFSKILNTDKAGPNGAGAGTLQVKDLQGTSFFESELCWITGPPKVAFGPEGEERVWEIGCAKVDRLDGGN